MKRIGMWVLMAVFVVGVSRVASAAETPAKKRSTPEEYFAKMDANSDGKLTLQELTAGKEGDQLERHKKYFSKMDANGDGIATLDEYKAAITAAHKAKK